MNKTFSPNEELYVITRGIDDTLKFGVLKARCTYIEKTNTDTIYWCKMKHFDGTECAMDYPVSQGALDYMFKTEEVAQAEADRLNKAEKLI